VTAGWVDDLDQGAPDSVAAGFDRHA